MRFRFQGLDGCFGMRWQKKRCPYPEKQMISERRYKVARFVSRRELECRAERTVTRAFEDRLTILELWFTLLNDQANGDFLGLIHLYLSLIHI